MRAVVFQTQTQNSLEFLVVFFLLLTRDPGIFLYRLFIYFLIQTLNWAQIIILAHFQIELYLRRRKGDEND